MSHVLLYSRPKVKEPIAEQSVSILCEQLQHVGHHVEVAHTLNIPRLILNSYDTVHLIIENLPLTANEAVHLGICKAIGKNTLISVLNSDRNLGRGFLNFVKPDALSVSQTNHFKYYRNIASNKFVLSAFPKKQEVASRKNHFRNEAFLIPLIEKLEEGFQFKIENPVYFDGRMLLSKNTSAQLRKKWNDLVANRKISENYHLILSDNKVNELLEEQALSVVLADSRLSHCQFTAWLGLALNKNNLVILNDYQATGFSNYWTSGRNCIVLPLVGWQNALSHIEFSQEMVCSNYKSSDLFEPTVNELSRLYSKLYQQKTSLLTSRSVKL